MRKRVYISGPLTSSGNVLANVTRAIEIARELIALGYAPLCPHLTYYIDPDNKIPHDVWMEVDRPWVELADVVLRMPGESWGGDIEVEHARKCGVPVVYSVTELQEVLSDDVH